MHRLVHLVKSLGWIIILGKSDLVPTQKNEFLGYKFDLRVGLVFPTHKEIDHLLEKKVSMLKAFHTSPRKLMSLIGSMASMEKTIPLGRRMHMKSLQVYLKTHDISSVSGYSISCVPCSQGVFQWWTNLSILKEASPLHKKEHSLLPFTDASLNGWGADLKHQIASGLWNQEESLKAMKNTKSNVSSLRIIQKSVSKSKSVISTDNSSLVAYLNKQGGTHFQEICALVWRIMAWTNTRGIQIWKKPISGNLSFSADSLFRRHLMIKTEWALTQILIKSAIAGINQWLQQN